MNNRNKYLKQLSYCFLPVPSSENAEKFKVLCQKRLGLVLTDAQALDGASRYLLIYWLATERPRPIS